MKGVTAESLLNGVNRLDLSVLYGEEYLGSKMIVSSRIQRPGLALAGYFEHIRSGRVQLFGETELNFLSTLAPSHKINVLSKLADINQCLFVVSKNLPVPEELMQVVMQRKVPMLAAAQTTVQVNNEISYYLDYALAPDVLMHGVCVEVHGLGIIITGDSGIGKSECALELVKRGHRLVADDIISIRRRQHYIVGSSNETLASHLELRGVGILNLSEMFGVTAIRPRKKIDLIINFLSFEEWSRRDDTDRLGLSERCKTILDIEVPETFCPVSPGRNMADVVEMAAKNQMMRTMGYNSAREFVNAVNSKVKHEVDIDE
ncbi:MAG: HPr(Ser) kinase/phosphatase [Deferribacteraceae bacterium]|nr:HPr(Ser) kinase/phosphatase [Deferribacteraceae bacterium]